MTPNRDLLVTTSWDDGTVTDVKLGELMRKYGIRGTFYASTSIGIPLSKEALRALDQEFEIGAHTLTHPDLTRIPLVDAESEIKGSKYYVEQALGHPVLMFCYPYGKYNHAVSQIVESNGFIGARTCKPGGLSLPKNPYQWHITLFASNSSPLMALRIWLKAHLISPAALIDWETRANALFDIALEKGGVYHIYGHSGEFKSNNDWDRLERVFAHISNRATAQYVTNGEVIRHRRL